MRSRYIHKGDYKVGDRVRVLYNISERFMSIGTVIEILPRIGRVAPLIEFDDGTTSSFAFTTSLELVLDEKEKVVFT